VRVGGSAGWTARREHEPRDSSIRTRGRLEESPWASYERRGLNANDLAKLLKPYGVRSTAIRFEDGVRKGYYRVHPRSGTDGIKSLQDAWTRYCTECRRRRWLRPRYGHRRNREPQPNKRVEAIELVVVTSVTSVSASRVDALFHYLDQDVRVLGVFG
jgi:hypothetical protein